MKHLILCRNLALLSASLASTFSLAHAVTIQNGSFTNLQVAGVSSQIGSNDNNAQNVTGWTASGYDIVFIGGTPNKIVANTQYGANNVTLLNTPPAVPGGGNYMALDSDYGDNDFSTTLTGLTVGQTVAITFDINGDQQKGPTPVPTGTQQLVVSLGGSGLKTQTDTITNLVGTAPSWTQETVDFTAGAASETLSFMAQNGPQGAPAFVLLSDVSATAVTPEPGSLALLGTGLLGVAGMMRKRLGKR